ncbi:MAG: hypothetical protein ACQESB_06320 [Elusimicrobiota bacterium]
MKKYLFLTFSFIFLSGSVAMAQSNTGVGFEYGGGYMMPFNDYEMRPMQSFALTVELSENLSAAIFRSDGSVRGENSYSFEDSKYKLINTADISLSGLRFKHAFSVAEIPLNAGLEIGTARFTNSDHTDNTADFGGADVEDLEGSHSLIGLLADIDLISAETETINVSVNAGAAYRIIALPDIYSLGSEETQAEGDPIDPVKSFNNLSFSIGLNIGF